MLTLMRENAGSWIIKILLAIIIIVFVFAYMNPGDKKHENIAATVNKKEISMEEYRIAYNNISNRYRQQFGNSMNEDFIKMLRLESTTLENLIDNTLLLQEADKMNINVAGDELIKTIMDVKVFQDNGEFSNDTYEKYIKYSGMTKAYFEIKQKEDLKIQKLRSLLTDSVHVSDEEAMEWFTWEKSQTSINYLLFEPSSYTEIKPTDEEIQAYYDKNKNQYKTSPTQKVSYLSFAPQDYKNKITIGDDEIQSYYERNQSKYETEKSVTARHILIKVDEKADAIAVETAKNKALDIYKKATVEKKDFSELAKEFSEGPSKASGGSLGSFTRGKMVKPFSDKAFAMKADEISEPVKTRFGWHIIKVEKITDASKKELNDVKDEITKALTKEKTETLAYEDSDDAFNTIIGGQELQDVADAKTMKLIKTESFTKQAGPLAVPAKARWDFAKTVFDMAPNEISDVLEFDGSYYIVQIGEKKGAETKSLETVKKQIETAVIAEMKDEKAKSEAASLLETLKNGQAEINKQTTVKTTGLFNRDNSGADLKVDKEVVTAAFSLSSDSPLSAEPVKGSKGYYLLSLKERNKPEASAFGKEKDRIKEKLLKSKKEKTFSSWLAQVKSKSVIERNQRLLN